MEPRDVYKLLYQGVRGPEHSILSPAAFTEQLSAEWESLELAVGDPLWESIRPDGSLLRLNLRPFKAEGGSLVNLIAACLKTGHRRWGTQAELEVAWENFSTLCGEQSWPYMSLERVKTFTTWLEANGYPPVHHSEQYRSLYRPAYRLVAVEFRLME